MSGTNPPGTSNAPIAEPKLEQIQQTQPAQAKAGSPPVQPPKPGRKPLFRK